MPIEPTNHEDDYFKRRDMEKLKAARQAAAAETAAAERVRLKETHWMRCPKCGMELAEVEFRGVSVDACFSCGGMFFDQGEVEKLGEEREKGMIGGMLSAFFGTGKQKQ